MFPHRGGMGSEEFQEICNILIFNPFVLYAKFEYHFQKKFSFLILQFNHACVFSYGGPGLPRRRTGSLGCSLISLLVNPALFIIVYFENKLFS